MKKEFSKDWKDGYLRAQLECAGALGQVMAFMIKSIKGHPDEKKMIESLQHPVSHFCQILNRRAKDLGLGSEPINIVIIDNKTNEVHQWSEKNPNG